MLDDCYITGSNRENQVYVGFPSAWLHYLVLTYVLISSSTTLSCALYYAVVQNSSYFSTTSHFYPAMPISYTCKALPCLVCQVKFHMSLK